MIYFSDNYYDKLTDIRKDINKKNFNVCNLDDKINQIKIEKYNIFDKNYLDLSLKDNLSGRIKIKKNKKNKKS